MNAEPYGIKTCLIFFKKTLKLLIKIFPMSYFSAFGLLILNKGASTIALMPCKLKMTYTQCGNLAFDLLFREDEDLTILAQLFFPSNDNMINLAKNLTCS